MKPNRYIKAMEIGLETQEKGISYFDLKDRIEKELNLPFGKESELTFLVWFNENFSKSNLKLSSEHIKNYRDHLSNNIDRTTRELIIERLSHPYWLDGRASKQYYDYLELVESRQTAQDAREASKEANIKAGRSIKLAVWAIIVSAAVGIISIFIDLAALNRSSVSNYDLRVIEDNTRTKLLEKENGKLKDKLYKAEMLLETYESDPLK